MGLEPIRECGGYMLQDPDDSAIRESVRAIACGYGWDYFIDRVRQKQPPTDVLKSLADHGFLGIHLPEEYGGGGRGLAELAAVVEEAAIAGVHLQTMVVQAIAGCVLARYGTTDQKRRWLPGLAAGTATFAFAITEPDAGSNAHNIKTVARRDGGDFLLSGQKTFCSAADRAQSILVVARTGTDDRTGKGLLSLFLVPPDATGLTTQYIPTAPLLGDRSFQVFFDDVRVRGEDLVGEADEGWRPLFDGLNPERIMVAAGCNGLAQHALSKGARYARERNVWGTPIGTHQAVSHPLAEAKIDIELARLMTAKAAARYDAGLPAGEASNMAKLAATDAAERSINRVIQSHGGSGFALDTGLTDAYWIARLHQVAPVSREMILNYVAQHSLGLPRSY